MEGVVWGVIAPLTLALVGWGGGGGGGVYDSDALQKYTMGGFFARWARQEEVNSVITISRMNSWIIQVLPVSLIMFKYILDVSFHGSSYVFTIHTRNV